METLIYQACKLLENASNNLRNGDLERFNDGKCDAMGRLIIGTMYCDGNDENVQNLSSLYRLEGRNLIQIETNFNVTNGFAWTKDAKNFFINDSGDRVIYQYDYDINLGEVKNKRILIDFNKTPLDGCSLNSLESPDGCIIDGEDKLWVALWDGSRIVNLDPNEFYKLKNAYMADLVLINEHHNVYLGHIYDLYKKDIQTNIKPENEQIPDLIFLTMLLLKDQTKEFYENVSRRVYRRIRRKNFMKMSVDELIVGSSEAFVLKGKHIVNSSETFIINECIKMLGIRKYNGS
ncbi:hypothetical protein RND71_043870 [Anisodus tanguticus]|uniref:SMP-30/Gluconolactonase/LRE-like region domain-containing protein n=1 Tax=Anisodus tanguticus TaxID=243964 RepID=A0AAE1QQH5_9SOLA|nr:hypothetical protein RND71_043870 [Anisodus tanguticus]